MDALQVAVNRARWCPQKHVEKVPAPNKADEVAILRARLVAAERQIEELLHIISPTGQTSATPPEPTIRRRPRIHDIKVIVARWYKVSLNDLDDHCRTASIVRVRQIAQHLCKRMTLHGLPGIGRQFGGRDHTTILHANRKIAALRLRDKELDDVLVMLEEKIVQLVSRRC